MRLKQRIDPPEQPGESRRMSEDTHPYLCAISKPGRIVLNEPLFFRAFRVFRGQSHFTLHNSSFSLPHPSSPLCSSRALLLNHLLPQPETFGSQNAHASRHGNSSLFILPLCLGAFVRDPLLPQPKPQVGTLTRPATKELPIVTPFCVFCDLCGKNSF